MGSRKRFLLLGIAVLTIFSVAEAEEIRYDTGGRRDPFIPLRGGAGVSAGPDALAVEGIIYDERGGSFAMMGGEIYREGESIEGTKLVKILPNRVVFFKESQEIVIWLREEILEKGGKELNP